jgi:predicted component of type VI protein secretion system
MPLILTLCPTTTGLALPPCRIGTVDIVIGSGVDVDVRLPDSQGKIAPRQCQIGCREGVYLIVDLGGFGTRLNDRPLDRAQRLSPGDRIGVAQYEFAIAPADSAPNEGQAGSPVDALLAAAGLARGKVAGDDTAIVRTAGVLLRTLVDGMVSLLAARARAKAEMGAEATALAIGAGNPMKLARDGEQALALLLAPATRGVMPAQAAVADAFGDLEAHQAATLRAMQGAMAATLDRFSPTAIRARADRRGLLSRVLPGSRDAALWQAYEREFDGVAKTSGEDFVDTFAREFRDAYQRISSAARPPS